VSLNNTSPRQIKLQKNSKRRFTKGTTGERVGNYLKVMDGGME
jgi:hypothetical protein